MIGMLESRIGKRAMVTNHAFHPADVHANHADISKAQAVLGWEPKINLEEGITRLVDWYMQERDWASQIETP
jgi:UDP-glucuronate 4-epimerase